MGKKKERKAAIKINYLVSYKSINMRKSVKGASPRSRLRRRQKTCTILLTTSKKLIVALVTYVSCGGERRSVATGGVLSPPTPSFVPSTSVFLVCRLEAQGAGRERPAKMMKVWQPAHYAFFVPGE